MKSCPCLLSPTHPPQLWSSTEDSARTDKPSPYENAAAMHQPFILGSAGEGAAGVSPGTAAGGQHQTPGLLFGSSLRGNESPYLDSYFCCRYSGLRKVTFISLSVTPELHWLLITHDCSRVM